MLGAQGDWLNDHWNFGLFNRLQEHIFSENFTKDDVAILQFYCENRMVVVRIKEIYGIVPYVISGVVDKLDKAREVDLWDIIKCVKTAYDTQRTHPVLLSAMKAHCYLNSQQWIGALKWVGKKITEGKTGDQDLAEEFKSFFVPELLVF